MKTLSASCLQISDPRSEIPEDRREEIEKVNRAIQNCKAKGTTAYISVDGKIYLVTARGVMLYEGTGTVLYSQSRQYREMANSAVSIPNKVPSLLVIGYGNPDYGDDAIASQVTTQLQALEIENVETCAVEQLKPELSTKLSTADYAIFVHACWMKTGDIKIKALDACGLETAGSSTPGCGHSWSPCSLLALTHSVYDREPQSWLVKVAGQNFETGHHLSDRAEQNIQNAVKQIEALIHQCIYEANCQEQIVEDWTEPARISRTK